MASRLGAVVSLLSLGVVVPFGLVGACDGNAFSSSPGGAGAGQAGESDGDGGMPASAGAAALLAGEGGGGSPSAEGGGAGQGGAMRACSDAAGCEAGEFCREGECASCTDFTDLATLAFGEPQPLSTINATIGVAGLRFARPSGHGEGLVYVRDFFGGRLWFTSDPNQSAGAALPAADEVFESGGLRITFPLPEPLAAHNFFFNRRPSGEGSLSKLYGATMDDSGVVTGVTELPAPLNGATTSSYSLALSERRAIWTENLDGVLNIRLKTVRLPPDGAEPTDLRLPLPFDCGFAGEFEYAPWLTPDGKILLFTARAYDETCTVTEKTPTRVYVIALSELGEPTGPARALSGLGPAELRQTDPALSADGCQLFFSGDAEGGMGLFRSQRVH